MVHARIPLSVRLTQGAETRINPTTGSVVRLIRGKGRFAREPNPTPCIQTMFPFPCALWSTVYPGYRPSATADTGLVTPTTTNDLKKMSTIEAGHRNLSIARWGSPTNPPRASQPVTIGK